MKELLLFFVVYTLFIGWTIWRSKKAYEELHKKRHENSKTSSDCCSRL